MANLTELVVWQEASKLAAEVHELCKKLKGYAKANAATQMIRAAESIGASIVEGVAKGVTRDCVRFLLISRASAQELEHHLLQSTLSGRVAKVYSDPVVGHTRRVRFLLRRFQESVERRIRERGD